MTQYTILTDLHTHTLASQHAYSTLEENCISACERGIEGIAMTDHAPAMGDGPYVGHFSNLKVLPEYIHGVRVWKGAELNILDFNGNVDLAPRILNRLDLTVASFHGDCCAPGTVEEHTNAYMQVLKNPKVFILGHSGSPNYAYDYEKVVKEAGRLGKAIELNEASFTGRTSSISNCRKLIELCKKHNTYISVDSDGHFSSLLGVYRESVKLLEEIEFPQELIVNRNLKSVEEWLNRT